ncbi:MAG TPA: glycosyltransferase family 87 protein [Gaiellaceae bacterium]|jgi:hypothetical protein|nr:glycosyltransferase family 87 protein [Gaiellaceae bacterium]
MKGSKLILAGAWVVWAATVGWRWHSSLRNPIHTEDFQAVYDAAGKVLHGGQLYTGVLGSYVYLPSTALLGLPFRAFTLSDATSLSILLQLVTVTVACFLIVRRFRGNPLLVPVCATVIALSEQTLSAELVGNVDLFIPLTVAACALLVDARREKASGLMYGLSIAIKPMIVVPAVLALVGRRWRFLGFAALVPAVLSIPVIAATSAAGFFSKAVPLLTSEQHYRNIQYVNITLVGVLSDEPRLLTDALRIAAGAASVLGVFALWRRSAPLGIRWLEATVAGQLGLALVGGFSFAHHISTALLLLPAAASVESLTRRPAVLAALLLLAAPRPLPVWNIQQQQCAAMAAVIATLLWAALHARVAAGEPAAVRASTPRFVFAQSSTSGQRQTT